MSELNDKIRPEGDDVVRCIYSLFEIFVQFVVWLFGAS